MGNSRTRVNPDPRRDLPSVSRLAGRLAELRPDLPDWAVRDGARRVIEEARDRISDALDGDSRRAPAPEPPSDDPAWSDRALAAAEDLARPHPRRVVNATGVVLHTNLGRAPIAPGAAEAALGAASAYSNLELDLSTGQRGSRLGSLEAKLCELAGSEAAYACNNNAAAVMLAVDTFARGREVLVSRGELVEIGGSFRVPDIMAASGARLVEVGTTNRTHARDYERAIGPDTALLLKVHRSNFHQEGFVAEVELEELVETGRRGGVPVMEDLGSGTFLDWTGIGFPAESYVPARVASGADVVCFSADKLLGGPQAGILLGRRDAIDAVRRNPLARAFRLDKTTLGALDWTLDAYLEGRAEQDVPAVRQILEPVESIASRAEALAERLGEVAKDALAVSVEPDRVPVGAGSLPGFTLETRVVALRGASPTRVAAALRDAREPVLARVRDDAVLLDLRTIGGDDLSRVVAAVAEALN